MTWKKVYPKLLVLNALCVMFLLPCTSKAGEIIDNVVYGAIATNLCGPTVTVHDLSEILTGDLGGYLDISHASTNQFGTSEVWILNSSGARVVELSFFVRYYEYSINTQGAPVIHVGATDIVNPRVEVVVTPTPNLAFVTVEVKTYLTTTEYPIRTLSVAFLNYEATEQAVGLGYASIYFTVRLNQSAPVDISVRCRTSGLSATDGVDYWACDQVITFYKGTVEKTVQVQIKWDALDEDSETFRLTLSDPSVAAEISSSASWGEGTIHDDDDPPSLSIDGCTLPEGDSGVRSACFNVNLSEASGRNVTVTYETYSFTALAGEDFTSVGPTELRFTAGETNKDIYVDVLGDTDNENDEQFYMDLDNVQNADLTNSFALGTILNDDDATLPVQLTAFSAEIVEKCVRLNWITQSETDNAGFLLERAVECVETLHATSLQWDVIASHETHSALRGQGNSSEQHEYRFVDGNVECGQSYVYRLSDVSTSGEGHVYDEISIALPETPAETVLQPPFPNPFNPETRISYQLAESGSVEIVVYDLLGREVQSLVNQNQSAGSYNIYWQGNDRQGEKVATGTYLIVLKTEAGVRVQKAVMMR